MGSLLDVFLSGEGFDVEICTDAAEARTVAAEFDPDLAILDVNLGQGMNGIQLGYILEQSHPAMAIMYLTRYPASFFSGPGKAAHISNKVVVSKDAVHSPKELLHAVEAALRGFTSNSDALCDEQLQQLTPLHWEILEMVAAGMTNTAIAQRRGTSERAVEKQLKSIYSTLGLGNDELNNARVSASRIYLSATGIPTLPTNRGSRSRQGQRLAGG